MNRIWFRIFRENPRPYLFLPLLIADSLAVLANHFPAHFSPRFSTTVSSES